MQGRWSGVSVGIKKNQLLHDIALILGYYFAAFCLRFLFRTDALGSFFNEIFNKDESTQCIITATLLLIVILTTIEVS